MSDALTFLDRLPLLSARVGYGEPGLHGRLGYEERAVTVGGEHWPHALGTHPPAALRFDLGSRFQTFRSRVALDDGVPAGASAARFTVHADGRKVASAHVTAGDPPAVLAVDVGGVQTLELRVETETWAHCHAVWLDPAVGGPGGRGAILDCLGRVEITLPEVPLGVERAIVTTTSPGFEGLLAGLLRTLRLNGRCDDAAVVVFAVGESAQAEALAAEYDAVLVPCQARAHVNPTVKAAMYSAPLVIDADAFVCLDADMAVLGDLRPLFATMEACPPHSILACRENNGRDYRDLGHALSTVYRGQSSDVRRILGRSSGEERYDLVVNDGLFAGRREALRRLDAAIRTMPGAIAWTDARSDVWWRNQFVFNLALATLRCGIEMDAIWNVQLNTQPVQFEQTTETIRAYWNGRTARVLHFNGEGRRRYPEWQRRLAGRDSTESAHDASAVDRTQSADAPRAVQAELEAVLATTRHPQPSAREPRLPLITCIMPTAGRPEYVRQAVRYFLRQDYPARELVIVDDAGAETDRPLRDDSRIRYHQVPAGWSIGAKRNHACALAKGEIVAHWDDDDWYAPDRLRIQSAPIRAGIADVTGLRGTVFFDLDAWRFWRCTPALYARLFVADVHGGTLLFRRALWGATRYPDVSLAEDAAFLQGVLRAGARLQRIDDEGLYLYLRHGTNSWQFACGTHRDARAWTRIDKPALPPADLAFYAALSPAAPSPTGLFVSAIMPTVDRRRFVPHAVRQFLRQDYPARELVVVDDGADSIADLLPDDPRVRHVQLDRRHSVGAKRNLACRAARGDLIAHWDDDDWYASDRLRVQVETLRSSDAALCGVQSPLFYAPADERAWRYVYPPGGRPWVHGATLCYRTSAWRRRPFRDVQVGEDSLFVWSHAHSEVAPVADSVFVGLIHPGNTSPKQTRGRRWTPTDVDEVRRLLGPDAEVYRELAEDARERKREPTSA